MAAMFHLTVERTICVAHGPDDALHGHNWVVRATVSAAALDGGRLLPPRDLESLLWSVVEPIDHRRLEDLAPFRGDLPPTAHGVALFAARGLSAALGVQGPAVTRVDVSDGEVTSSWTADGGPA